MFLQSKANPAHVNRKARSRSRMMDTTTVDWLGEAVGSKGKRKMYTKAIINKKVVRDHTLQFIL